MSVICLQSWYTSVVKEEKKWCSVSHTGKVCFYLAGIPISHTLKILSWDAGESEKWVLKTDCFLNWALPVPKGTPPLVL